MTGGVLGFRGVLPGTRVNLAKFSGKVGGPRLCVLSERITL